MKRFMFIVLLSTNVTADIILKDGDCPSGYHQSGKYCLGNTVNSKTVVDKVGFCPTGFHQSGNYCIEN